MRNSRFVVALVAVACAAALPAAAAAHKQARREVASGARAITGKGNGAPACASRRPPARRPRASPSQAARRRSERRARRRQLTPGAFYAAHVHAGSCAAPGAVALRSPTSTPMSTASPSSSRRVPTAAGANYFAGGFYVDVHAGPSASATPVISCGDIAVKPRSRRSRRQGVAQGRGRRARPRGARPEGQRRVRLDQAQRPHARRARACTCTPARARHPVPSPSASVT